MTAIINEVSGERALHHLLEEFDTRVEGICNAQTCRQRLPPTAGRQ
jgi:hypothetical protein